MIKKLLEDIKVRKTLAEGWRYTKLMEGKKVRDVLCEDDEENLDGYLGDVYTVLDKPQELSTYAKRDDNDLMDEYNLSLDSVEGFKESFPTFESWKEHLHSGIGKTFETTGEDLEYIKKQDNKKVWTIIDGGGSDLLAIPGYHVVDALNYVVTKEPWTDESEQYLF